MSLPKTSRRTALKAGGVGLLNLAVPGLVVGKDKFDATGKAVASKKCCIFVLLCGGPSHIDTWDLKPDAPSEIRGPYKPIRSKVPGMQLSELHPKLSQVTDQFCLIRSMTHPRPINNHFDAMHNLLCGQVVERVREGVPDDLPYIGSVVAKHLSNERNLITNAWLIKCVGAPVFCAPNIGSGGYLGSSYAPVFIGSADNHPAMPKFKLPEIYDSGDPARMQERRKLLDTLESNRLAEEPQAKDWHELRELAYDAMTRPEGRAAFDLKQEPLAVRERYGMHPLGQNLCLVVASFVGSGLVGTSAALAVMLGADVGTALMAVVFSFDLSWLSPLLIFVGVVMFISRQNTNSGRIGRVLIGLGLITLALQLIVGATKPLTASPAVRALLVALPNDVMMDIIVGAALAVLSYSSLAIVLLTATLASEGLLPVGVALGLVLGANVGSGALAMLITSNGKPELRRLPLGNFIFKVAGALVVIPILPQVHVELQQWLPEVHQQVVVFHLLFNTALALLFIGFTGPVARLVERLLPTPRQGAGGDRPHHLDPVALATPSLAISCAAREALHQADVVETMLRGVLPVMRDNDLVLAERLRQMDDTVDDLYSAIKFYLTQISREALSEREGRRWADIISFTINMEQIGDSIERVLQDLEDKKIRKNRSFSDAGMAEICHLHERLLSNLRLGMSVFLDGHVRDAQKLLEEKARFRDLEHAYAANHIGRLRDNTAQSIETSSLHLDLISELKRINSHICSIAYPILESAGALSATRIRHGLLGALDEADRQSKPG